METYATEFGQPYDVGYIMARVQRQRIRRRREDEDNDEAHPTRRQHLDSDEETEEDFTRTPILIPTSSIFRFM